MAGVDVGSYRLLFVNAKTWVIAGELPVHTLEAETVLNAPGALRATMPLSEARGTILAAQRPAPVLDATELGPGRTALFLERDGVIVWSGMMWTRRINADSDSLEVGAEGWLSYYRKRYLNTAKTYTGVDQTLIAKDLIDTANSAMGALSGVDTSGVVASGVLRDRTYAALPREQIGELLENLAAVEYGFDFSFPAMWNGNELLVRFLTTYPATGRPTDLILEVGTNIDLLEWTSDGTELANLVMAEGSGSPPILGQHIDLSMFTDYPRIEAVLQFSDVSSTTTLESHAREHQRLHRAPTDVMRVEMDPDVVPTVGSYEVGDILRVRGFQGAMSVDQPMRVVAQRLQVDEDGAESVSLDLGNVP